MKIIIVGMVSVLLVACSSTGSFSSGLTAEEYHKLQRLNSADLIAVLKTMPNNLPQYSCLMSERLQILSVRPGSCGQSKIIDVLNRKGAKFYESRKSFKLSGGKQCSANKALTHAIASQCPEIAKVAINSVPRSSLVFVAKNNLKKVPHPGTLTDSKVERGGKRKKYDSAVTILKALLDEVGESCLKKPISDDCLAQKNIEKKLREGQVLLASLNLERTQLEDYRAREEERVKKFKEIQSKKAKYESSPEGILESACSTKKHLRTIASELKRHKEIARRSGLIDKYAVHQLTQAQIYSEKDLKSKKQKYFQQTNRKINLNHCK